MPAFINQLFGNRIGRRLALAVLLCAAALIILLTSVQLYDNYEHSLEMIESDVETIGRGYIRSLAENVWVYNDRQIIIQLEGLIKIPEVEYLEVADSAGYIWSVGKRVSRRIIKRTFPLIHTRDQVNHRVGRLTVVAGLDKVRMRVLKQASDVALKSALGVLVLFGCILLIFHRMVTRRLINLAKTVREVDFQQDRSWKDRLIDRSTDRDDEIGQVVEALAGLQTELLKQIEALKDSEARYRSLFDNTPAAIFVQDFSEAKNYLDELASRVGGLRPYLTEHPEEVGRLVASIKNLGVNQAAMALYEAEDETDLVYSMHKAMPAEGSPHYIDQLLTLYDGGGVFQSTGRNLTLKGKPIDLLIRKAVLPGHEDDLSRVLAIVVDLTEMRRVELEKKDLEDQLRIAQKMEAVGALAGGAAHDLNNLLAPIIGYSELMSQDEALDGESHSRVDSILQAALGARDLVGRLLAFARKQAMEIKPVDLNGIIVRFEKLIRQTVREDIGLTFDLSAGELVVRADAGQVEQVIMNLVVNAQDAMPEGGEVNLETTSVYLDEEYAAVHPEVAPGRYAMLAVSDTGRGIDRETRDRIFDPFFTTKEKGKGTGLGLATVYGIVKQHQGSIWVYSEPDQGTTFKIYLPASDEAAESGGISTEPDQGIHGEETILVVEDDQMVRDLVVSFLTSLGYAVLEADCGQAGLDLAVGCGDRIDLLLTDVIMPGLNGKQLYEKLAAVKPGLKVIYMSGYTDNVIAHRGVLDPGVHFIQKPFSVAGLAKKIRQALND